MNKTFYVTEIWILLKIFPKLADTSINLYGLLVNFTCIFFFIFFFLIPFFLRLVIKSHNEFLVIVQVVTETGFSRLVFFFVFCRRKVNAKKTLRLYLIEGTQFKSILIVCVVALGALNSTFYILSLQLYFNF